MRDYYPKDWAFQKWLSEKWLLIGKLFGYQEYEGPLLESVELYLGKSSEEIVNQQAFRLQDRNGQELLLRPELTPTLARMIAQREAELIRPMRWQSYGRFFRYEKPQRGRGRSFFQWNIDLMGSESILADAEIITIACLNLKTLGITPSDAKIRISDRQTMQQVCMQEIGITDDVIPQVFRIIDGMDKVTPEASEGRLRESGLADAQTEHLMVKIEEKNPSVYPRLD